MTEPDVPLRMEHTFEVAATPEQVWQAIATGEGITAWFLPTDVEEREGGAIVTHMGDTDSPGTITGWEPPRRFAYEEPGWAGLVGHEGAPVTPLATEFLVEATSGGTCVVRVVSSAFGTGAGWEQEFFADMERHWVPFFDHLRLYLSHFPGQRATILEAETEVPATASATTSAMRNALGVSEVGQAVDADGLRGQVERLRPEETLLRLEAPDRGFVSLYAYEKRPGTAVAGARGYLFSDGSADMAERRRPAWQTWLEGLALSGA